MKIEADIMLCDDHARVVPLVIRKEYDEEEFNLDVIACAMDSRNGGDRCRFEKIEGLFQARCVQEAGK